MNSYQGRALFLSFSYNVNVGVKTLLQVRHKEETDMRAKQYGKSILAVCLALALALTCAVCSGASGNAPEELVQYSALCSPYAVLMEVTRYPLCGRPGPAGKKGRVDRPDYLRLHQSGVSGCADGHPVRK